MWFAKLAVLWMLYLLGNYHIRIPRRRTLSSGEQYKALLTDPRLECREVRKFKARAKHACSGPALYAPQSRLALEGVHEL